MIIATQSVPTNHDIDLFTIGSVAKHTPIAPSRATRPDAHVVLVEEPDIHLHPDCLRSGLAELFAMMQQQAPVVDVPERDLRPSQMRAVSGSVSKKDRDAWGALEERREGFSLQHELVHTLIHRQEQGTQTREELIADAFAGWWLANDMQHSEHGVVDRSSHAQAAPRSRCSHRVRSVRAGTSSGGGGDGGDGDGDGGDGRGERRSVHDLLAAAARRARRITNAAQRELRETAINELALRWLNNPDQLARSFSDGYVNTSIKHMEWELMDLARSEASREVPYSSTRNASDGLSALEGARMGNDPEARISAFTQLLHAWKLLCDRALHFAQAVFFDAMGFKSREIAKKLSTAEHAVKAATVRKWIERGHATLRAAIPT